MNVDMAFGEDIHGKRQLAIMKFKIVIMESLLNMDNRTILFQNYFKDDSVGIKIWEREKQPEDWGYAKNRETSSVLYNIKDNYFENIKVPLDIQKSTEIYAQNNKLFNSNTIKEVSEDISKIHIHDNKLVDKETSKSELIEIASDFYPELPDGQNTFLHPNHLRGRQYILVNEWGPYDFKYPVIWLREIKDNKYTFLLLGPQGNWKSVGGKGLKKFWT